MAITHRASYRGRFAPSPTGPLHLGSARTALVAWARARTEGGAFVLRMEDLDPPRVVPGAASALLRDLAWLGLDWDEGPDVGGAVGPYVQSERGERYTRAIDELTRNGNTYRCTCTRKQIASIASAPHDDDDQGPRYPGTCRVSRPRSEPVGGAIRVRIPEPPSTLGEPSAYAFIDGIHGPVTPATVPDDFVLRRSDGLVAYQLAVVVDDAAMGVTEVVRGDDLLSSTPRQIALYRLLGLAVPRFAHVPLVLGPDGARLAKRHGAIGVAALRDAGHPSTRIIVWLATTLGLYSGPAKSMHPKDVLDLFAFERIPKTAVTVDPQGFPF